MKDTAKGFLEIFKSDALFGQATNIGMNKEISMGDIAKLIAELMGEKIEIVSDKIRVRPDQSEVVQLMCNNSKLTTATNWQPSYTLKSGLLETIAWLKENEGFYKPELYNV